MKYRFAKYNILFLIVTFLPLAILSMYSFIHDPYWIYMNEPKWKSLYNGHNRVLDIRNRYSKTLQVVAYQPDVILIGSSRVYRGMPTGEKLYQDKKVYNYGISSLRIREMYSYLVHSLRWTEAREVIIGLDYFIFNSLKQNEKGFDNSTENSGYYFKALFSSLMSKMAYGDVQLAMSGEHSGDGYWNITGYKKTNQRTFKDIKRILCSFYNDEAPITDDEYKVFHKILCFLSNKGIATSVFISPLNNEMIARMKNNGHYEKFRNWKNQIAAITSYFGIFLLDFSETNPFFYNYPYNDSNQDWIDSSHYSPSTGRWIINTILYNNALQRTLVKCTSN